MTNSGGAPTTGTITVADALPTGLTATAFAGTGWTCTVSTALVHAQRFDRRRRERARADADGERRGQRARERHQHGHGLGRRRRDTSNNTATDATTIVGGPDLTITKTHTGNFTQGQTGATYTITVTNSGTAATSGDDHGHRHAARRPHGHGVRRHGLDLHRGYRSRARTPVRSPPAPARRR